MLKRVETKGNKEKKQRIRNIIMGGIIVALMVLSTIGYVIVDQNGNTAAQDKKTYNGFEFKQTENGWQTNVQGSAITTMYLPQEIFDSNGTGFPNTYGFVNKVVFVVVDNEQEAYASYDLVRNLNLISNRVQFACDLEHENSSFCQEKNLPTKECDNLDSGSGLVSIKTTNSSLGYSVENGCWTIMGEGNGLIKSSDNFIFKLFGVI